jgi:hypothetical protein
MSRPSPAAEARDREFRRTRAVKIARAVLEGAPFSVAAKEAAISTERARQIFGATRRAAAKLPGPVGVPRPKRRKGRRTLFERWMLEELPPEMPEHNYYRVEAVRAHKLLWLARIDALALVWRVRVEKVSAR